MLSKKCKYALRAVLFVSTNSSDSQKVGLVKTAGSLNIPGAFLGKIMQELTRKGIITSVKGPGGGFCLEEQQQSMPIMRIVDAIDGADFFEDCALGLFECSTGNPCPLHNEFKEFRDKLKEVLESTTIAKLSEEIVTGISVLSR